MVHDGNGTHGAQPRQIYMFRAGQRHRGGKPASVQPLQWLQVASEKKIKIINYLFSKGTRHIGDQGDTVTQK